MPNPVPTRDEIVCLIASTAKLLPTQGPIDVFVAQNILQGFEDRPFEEAVLDAARTFGTEPFLPESVYREEYSRGRIHRVDLHAVLDADLGPRGADRLAAGRISVRDLLAALLEHPVRQEDDAAVRWTLTEREPFKGDAAEDLWHACMEAVALVRATAVDVRPPARPRDLIVAADPTLDTDALVHPLVIRLAAAFLDQGVAAWPMPGRDRGLLDAVAGLFAGRAGPTEPWASRLPAALASLRGRDAIDVIADEITRLGVPASTRAAALAETLLALRGWAGMFHQVEQRPDRLPVAPVPARLADFLALRLVLDRVATEWAAARLGHAGDVAGMYAELRDRYPRRPVPGSVSRAFLLCQVALLAGLPAEAIRALEENELIRLERAVQGFDQPTRRRLLHLAYERRLRIMLLDALATQDGVATPPPDSRPVLQAVLCMDERCESLRRHLEELAPGYETFGTAGFFAVPMYYRGIDDWHATPLCPIVMRPEHTVVEVPVAGTERRNRERQAIRRWFGRMRGGASSGSHTLLRGGLLTAIGGALAAVPLVAGVVFPRLTGLLARRTAEFSRRHVLTRLHIERTDDHPLPDGTRAGFSVDEMARIVTRVLEDIGLTRRFARLVAILGHGSTSLNNPHESAYDCGACGGGRGGPNARVFATMANDPRVREILRGAGLAIPDDTFFVAGMHDTCSNGIVFFDGDGLPATHRADFARLQEACAAARAADAQERCRRFDSVPLGVTPAEALRRAEGRANDLAQVRPELGHATNAVCVVGRRWRTRGLFLDRRAFLVSYDPDDDPDGAILTRTLAAVGPVGAGINLAYAFSRIDPIGYGCGSKLPHNITGLIGVMDGHASDLRTGLPWQAVEIHEPVRLLFVIDAPAERILKAAERVPAVQRLIANEWVQLVAWDGCRLSLFERGSFVHYAPESTRIATVEQSVQWFSGQRGHLPPARVTAALTGGRSP